MAMLCTVMAFATVHTAGTYQELQDALSAAANGDEIQLTADINYGEVLAANSLNITKSITLDGQNHTLKGASQRPNGGSNYATIWINQSGSQVVNVTIKDLTVINERTTGAYNNKGIETRGNIGKVTLDNVSITSKTSAFQVGGNQSTKATFEVNNCYLHTTVYYPICSFNPYDMTITNSVVEGWCAFYFKPAYQSNGDYNSCAGSRGSSVVATNCTFNTTNIYNSVTNGFGTFVLEDDNISITLNNCATNSIMLGNQEQSVLVLSGWAQNDHRSLPVSLTINGDNSYINGNLLSNDWAAGWDLSSGSWVMNPELIANPFPLSIEFTGGTYAFNPAEAGWLKNETLPTEELYDPSNIQMVTIPAGYEVKEIETQQGEQTTTLYRVRKTITTSNSINDNVEGEGKGQNEHTEFLISGDETVEQASTVANYVEVSNNATLTLPEGKTLEVTNGLDVTDGATLDVAAGSTLIVGEGGVTFENTNSIVIESNENGSASFLLSPEVVVNTTPNLTVKMTVKGKGYKNESAGKTYYWHRFAAPVVMAEEWSKAPNYGTWLYGWDYNANGWTELSSSKDMVPFQGYTLSPEHEIVNENEEIVYSFKGQLAGNQPMTLNFNARGFNFFGNSYTGYISVLTLVDQLMANENIDGTVYVWKNDGQGYQSVSLKDLEENPTHYEDWEKEIAPMQTFILRQVNTGDAVSTKLDYATSVWGNPRYSSVTSASPAPARRTSEEADPFVRVMITAANGQNSQMSFAENADRSDDFEKGYDALVYMNENTINVYSTLEGQDYANVATNNLEGKTITLQTNGEVAYTMSFPIVDGEKYAIRDNVTGNVIAIEEGATYEFAAQPNSTVEGRFEIVSRAQMPTAIENTEVNANVKGIYTIMGQYMGEDFSVLPAGVYVINGVKIVK